MSELEREIISQQNRVNSEREAVRSSESLWEEVERISGDPSGTPLDAILDTEQVDVCREFLDLARARNFPKATPIDFKVKRTGGPVWRKSLNMSGGTDDVLFLKSIWQGKGYSIGSVEMRSTLMLCTDGALRCERRSSLWDRKSYGTGFGRVPVRASITIGHYEEITGYNDSRNTHEFRERPIARVLAGFLTI